MQVHAQDGATASAAEKEKNLEEARERYKRGLQLFNEGNYEAARVEFERAYQLAPSYKILYNVGLCYEQLGDYVQALTTLQRYLEQGGIDISPERRSEVAKELAQIRPRIARVTIKVNVKGGELLVDDACSTEAASGNVQCGPLLAESRIVLMNPGRRRVTLRRDGYFPETQVITVAGSDQAELTIFLKPIPKEVAVKKSNPFVLPTIVGFSVAGAAAIGGTVTGVLATKAADDQTQAVDSLGANREDLDSKREKTRQLATATDILFIGAGVSAAVSTYFLIRMIRWKPETVGPTVGVGPGGVSVSGSF